MTQVYDLIVISGSSQGLSSAIYAHNIGVSHVRVIEQSAGVAYPELIGQYQLDVGFGENVLSIDEEGGILIVTTNKNRYETNTVIVAGRSPDEISNIPEKFIGINGVHQQPLDSIEEGCDILIVGDNDRSVVLASQYVKQGAQTVLLASKDFNPDLLSPMSLEEIDKLEQKGALSVFYRSEPAGITELDGEVFVDFGNSRIPELVFDHVIFVPDQQLVIPQELGITQTALASQRIMYVCDPRISTDLPSGTTREILSALAPFFSTYDKGKLEEMATLRNYKKAIPELCEEKYNATITYFEKTHSDLWIIRIKPDQGHKGISHHPGQYVSVALGYWEDRIDDVIEPDIDTKWDKSVSRNYSISNRIFSDDGYLASETENGELEFYIVLVRPSEGHIPGLTPRLALKEPGDRIFLGGKLTGHYTLEGITDPDTPIIFLATGTGEAPHNSMIVQLLKRGHRGPIISAINVRKWEDLGYRKEHEELQKRYPNYTYLGLPTREADVPKRYMQDLITNGELEETLGQPLDPEKVHVFACGNPSMVGAPDKKTKELPKNPGIVGLLLERGFTIAERKQPGNLHFESFWD